MRCLLWLLLLALVFATPVKANEVDLYCYTGGSGIQAWAPCSAVNPLQTSGGGGGGVVTQPTASLLNMTEANSAAILAALQSPIAGVTQAQTGAAASSLVAKASAGSVISISGSAVSGSYIMVFNATSAPGDGAVTPVKCWGPMAAAGPFAFGWGPGPVLTMSTGITVVSSSTGCFTKTATNANFIAVEYQ